jgi:hypothetical protein
MGKRRLAYEGGGRPAETQVLADYYYSFLTPVNLLKSNSSAITENENVFSKAFEAVEPLRNERSRYYHSGNSDYPEQ